MNDLKENVSSNNMQVEIDNQFARLYARNNKSKTKKNMRCFPHCCANGHREKGFCGTAIRTRVSGGGLTRDEISKLVVVGGIKCDEENPWCAVGDIVDESSLAELVVTLQVLQVLQGGVSEPSTVSESRQGAVEYTSSPLESARAQGVGIRVEWQRKSRKGHA